MRVFWHIAGWLGFGLLGGCASLTSAPSPVSDAGSVASVSPAARQPVHWRAREPGPRPKPPHALPASRAQALERFVELGVMDSVAGEGLTEFLVRVAQVMQAFTTHTGFEACGVIQVHAEQLKWRVRLTTSRAHIGCTLVAFPEPGFVSWGADIHSHPRLVGGFLTNAQDVRFRPTLTCGRKAYVFDTLFSAQDFKRGEGYLVARGRLLRQRGVQWPFQYLAPVPVLSVPVEQAGLRQPRTLSASASPQRGNSPQHVAAVDVAAAPESTSRIEPGVWTREDGPGLLGTACLRADPVLE